MGWSGRSWVFVRTRQLTRIELRRYTLHVAARAAEVLRTESTSLLTFRSFAFVLFSLFPKAIDLADDRTAGLPASCVEKYYTEINTRAHIATRVVSHRITQR